MALQQVHRVVAVLPLRPGLDVLVELVDIGDAAGLCREPLVSGPVRFSERGDESGPVRLRRTGDDEPLVVADAAIRALWCAGRLQTPVAGRESRSTRRPTV